MAELDGMIEGRRTPKNGNPYAQYDSLFNKLLKLPEETLVYPARDYKDGP